MTLSLKTEVPTVVSLDDRAIETLIDQWVIKTPHLCTFL